MWGPYVQGLKSGIVIHLGRAFFGTGAVNERNRPMWGDYPLAQWGPGSE